MRADYYRHRHAIASVAKIGDITIDYCSGAQWICAEDGSTPHWIEYSGRMWSSFTEASEWRLNGKITPEEFRVAEKMYNSGLIPD